MGGTIEMRMRYRTRGRETSVPVSWESRGGEDKELVVTQKQQKYPSVLIFLVF